LSNGCTENDPFKNIFPAVLFKRTVKQDVLLRNDKEANMKKTYLRLFESFLMMLAILMVFFGVTAEVFGATDSYPSKAVRLIIPFPPGGSNDIVGRLIASKLTERLGKQVFADNRGGAGGVLGTEMAAKSQPDGYTLLIVAAGHAINATLYKLPYDPEKDFTPIAKLGSGPNALVIHPSVQANSVRELIALAKQQPGRVIATSAGIGSFHHLATELFKMMTGIDIKIVQFKGGGPAMIDHLGGHSHIAMGSLIQALSHIQSGKLKVLGTGGVKRSSILPNTPTISEAGVPGYEASNWWGVVAPAGTPKPIVARLNNEIMSLLAMEEIKNLFLKEGADVDYMGPAKFSQFITGEITKWGRVVKEANVKVE
jgi:tripartite-type tricarboxylate transporter receptor subunit TctC